jgi:hypothetical protein
VEDSSHSTGEGVTTATGQPRSPQEFCFRSKKATPKVDGPLVELEPVKEVDVWGMVGLYSKKDKKKKKKAKASIWDTDLEQEK